MALTKKMLRAMGIEDDKADQIMDAHTETVDALKEQRDQYKADAEKLPAVQKQLDQAAADLESAGKDPYKVKYDALKEEYAQYKAGQQAKEARSAKESRRTSSILFWVWHSGLSGERRAAGHRFSVADV